jgi:hypothetical protein
MKNTYILLAASIAVLSFSSCKKSNTSSSSTVSSALPKTYNENVTSSISGNENVTFNLSYDGSNRLVSLAATAMPGLKELYKYNADGSFSLDLYDDGTDLSIHENFFLNSNNLVDSTFQYDDSQDTTTEKYYYNSAKQLIAYTEYDYSKQGGSVQTNVTTYNYDTNGNVIKSTDENGITTYTYTTYSYSSYGIPDYFAHDKNLVLTTTNTSGGNNISVTDTYTFDSSNRIVTDKAVANNGDVIIKTYTY